MRLLGQFYSHLQLLEQALEGVLGGLVDHDLHHLLADELLLRVLRVGGGLDLTLVSAGEGDAEHTEQVAV